MPSPLAHVDPPLRFGRFEISAAERALRVDGQPVPLGARAFDLLLALAERRERLVTREELLDVVWPGVVVEEHNITAQISTLRKLLGPQAIATVPGRGYRFVAQVDAAPAGVQAGLEDAARNNLPEPRTRFIGREAELADLARLLPQARLLTLTGIGGCGKTRMALQLARQQLDTFADGVWFVDLAPLVDAQRVASTCTAALGLGAEPEPPPLQRLADHLSRRQALLVLDNCEQVREGVAALVDVLLARPGASRILATSREPLAVAGEQLYPVPPLSLPAGPDLQDMLGAEAVRVFVDRARLALPGFALDAGNAAAVVDVCRQLDGIALAIELAAARVPMLAVAEIAARLQDRFRLLTGGSAAAARHQTLLATMQWSHDLLAPAERHMLCHMAVFAGGWTLQAAAAVAGTADEYEALAQLTALHDKSLLVVDRGRAGDDNDLAPRYRMLDTVRHYAQQQLEAGGATEAARARHAAHFLALAERAAPHMRGPQQSLWMARLAREQENLLAALTWCADERNAADPAMAERGLRLAAATARFWLFNEVELGCRLMRGALQRDRSGADTEARFRTLLELAAMHMHRGQRDAGLPHARAAEAVARRLGATEWQAMALCAIGNCLRVGDEEAALRYYEQARDLARAGGHTLPLAAALNNIATTEFGRGLLDSAETNLRQALHLSRALGDVRTSLIQLHNLVRVQVTARRPGDARAFALESATLLRGVGEDALKLELLEVSANLAASLGEHAFAARMWGYAVPRYAEAGYIRPPEDEALLMRSMATARQALGDAVFADAEAAGRTLGLETAIVELRQWLEGGEAQAPR